MKKSILAILALAATMSCTKSYDVLVVGGGASGTAAGVQAARMGSTVMIAEETPWIGGMLTSAGVSAIDGNYNLRGGFFREFTDAVAEYYGGYESLKTAWVSYIMYEPSVGEQILEEIVSKEKNITLNKGYIFNDAKKLKRGWKAVFTTGNGLKKTVKCRILVDGTELGDVAKQCGVKYHIGFDPRSYTGEPLAFEEGNDVIQDLTMVVTLKDFGPDADMTIEKPADYDMNNYVNCCKNPLNNPELATGQPLWSPEMMLTYGKLPNGKYMINWPVFANDYYLNIIEMSRDEREKALQAARNRTLGFVYFVQTELGYKNLGIADDEYPTEDGLAIFPYHRESRRIEAEHLFTLDQASSRYDFNSYRTGIAVGDYPVDHHHYAHPDYKKYCHLWFGQIPSFSLPAGTLVPLGVEDLIVAEKSIGVSNLINGTTRLQPVVLEIGQAAGVIAALACKRGCAVREVDVRSIQKELLESGAYIQPYRDLKPDDEFFQEVQRIGSTGILRAEGKTVDWSNQSWMHIDEPLRWCDLFLEDYYGIPYNPSEEYVSKSAYFDLLTSLGNELCASDRGCCEGDSCCDGDGCCGDDCEDGESDHCDHCGHHETITRLQAIVAIDRILDPFSRPVDFHGNLL